MQLDSNATQVHNFFPAGCQKDDFSSATEVDAVLSEDQCGPVTCCSAFIIFP